MEAIRGGLWTRWLVIGALYWALPVGVVRAQAPGNLGADGTQFPAMTSNVRSVARAVAGDGSHVALAATFNVAIVASAANDVAAPWFTDPQNRLIASGKFASVTVINAGAITPTLADLNQFDAVIVWSNLAFADPTILGNNLADYVDGGGSVVVAVFADSSQTAGRALAGRWQSGDFEVILSASGTVTGSASLGVKDQPSHPILQGVNSFAGGTSSFRPMTTALVAGAQRVAAWDDGSTLVAVRDDKAGRRVDLGFYPPSDVVQADFWSSTTAGGNLLVNALLFAATPPPVPAASRWGIVILGLAIITMGVALKRVSRFPGYQ